MDYVEIGRINKPHGLNGEIKADIDERYWNDVASVDAFFVDLHGSKAPFFIEYIRGKGTLILKFEDIDSKEDASLFSSKRLYLRSQDISLTNEEINDTGLRYSFLEGFMLFDQQAGAVGIIKSVEDFPQQEMACVDFNNKIILIPLLENWIIELDKNSNKIIMNLPDGLLNI
jgi:16S rRNA processing protein RimM